jgi:pimeloyl-ACP methyl ester carboxylesterase
MPGCGPASSSGCSPSTPASGTTGTSAHPSSAPFGALRQVDAGLLNVGYAEAGPAVILLHGWPDDYAYAGKFPGKYEHRVVEGGIGHDLPQEAPQAFAQAIIDAAGF